MIKKLLILQIAYLLFNCSYSRADEGMWIPALLKKYNEADMQKKGLKITAEDIYSINKSSLKDAVVLFGRGCTAELVSDNGLILTNHHCGYGRIQSHSTLENDYLTNGFWAMSLEEELKNPGLSVSFLIRMEDVTDKILANVNDDMSEGERTAQILIAGNHVVEEAINNTHYEANVKPLYYGNQYFLYVTEVFKDVRLVGAPPSAIGKFGGDTDNWMWPRHTGDFSIFRIYADKDNHPTAYSSNNVPYKPKKHFKISLKGVEKGDFTMVYGYPYSTQEYIPSYAVEMIALSEFPVRIKVREKRLEIYAKDMNENQKVRIQYASKHAGISNGWKKWIGVLKGLKRLNTLDEKRELEEKFTKWVNMSTERKEKYVNILSEYEKNYKELTPINLWNTYFYEAIWGIEIIKYANNFSNLASLRKDSPEAIEKEKKLLISKAKSHFKNYNEPTDRKVFSVLLTMFYEGVDKSEHPNVMNLIESKFNGDFKAFTDFVFENSFMTSEDKVIKFLTNYKASLSKKIIKDPAFIVLNDFLIYREKKFQDISRLKVDIAKLNRVFMAGLMEMQGDKLFYPDANASLRLTYGKIDDYFPADAVHYNYHTTLEGIIEKDDPDIYDYKVPDKLKEIYKSKDYGRYGVDGTMPVCFTASNHTTGGNSGSPVLDGYGNLIGINFDRNWNGTMSDIMYDPDQCRNISLDIRYCLFIIDKYAGAKYLIDEMEIIE